MTAQGNASAVGVEDLDHAGLLTRLADAEVRDREVQREKLELAYQWCVRHPATAETGAATWGDAGLPGMSDCDASLAGDGSPAVAAFAAEEVGAALGISTHAAMALLADTLDLHHRLPRLWAQVEALAVAPWKARRVATDTRTLPLDGARRVDAQLADRVTGFGLPTIDRLVALAAARYAPEEQDTKEQQSRAGWHVTLTHPRPGDYAGTSWLEAAGDTTDLTAFHDLVCAEAQLLGRLGDTDDYGVRQAKALGVIAARQATLELVAQTPQGHQVTRRPVQTNLYLHLSLADLTTHLTDGTPVVGEAERLGPVTVDLIRTWLQDSKATIRPVLDLTRTDAVDRHDPPPWMREQVILRDRHCVFPGAAAPPVPATSTTSTPTSHPTKAVHPARRRRRTSHRCAEDTIGPRPSRAGPTGAPATAATSGPHRTTSTTSSRPALPSPATEFCLPRIRAVDWGSAPRPQRSLGLDERSVPCVWHRLEGCGAQSGTTTAARVSPRQRSCTTRHTAGSSSCSLSAATWPTRLCDEPRDRTTVTAPSARVRRGI